MHIRDIINKKTAFTLAEMMVILTVMSVVMAATMPIITAPDNAILGGTATATDNYWTYNSGFKSASTKAGKAELAAVSMQVDSQTRDYDTSSLFVKVPSGDYRNASHILFTNSSNGSRVYNAGRLYMGPANQNNVALGAFALKDNTGRSIDSVAIGSMAMYSNNSGFDNSVAIGSEAMYSRFGATNSVAIGYRALYGNLTSEESTAIGYLAGATNSSDYTLANTYELANLHVGKLAGYKSSVKVTGYNTNIGYQAGALMDGLASVNIGYMAGFNSGGLGKIAIGPNASVTPQDLEDAGSLMLSVALGDHALYAPQANVSNSIAIGSYAGYNIRGRNPGNIFIGRKAGYWLQRGNPHENDVIAIGNYAGYKGSGTAVAIGSYAGSSLSGADATYDGDSLTQKERPMASEIAIGYRSGTSTGMVFDYSYGYGNISIGHSSQATGLNNIAIGRESWAVYSLGYSILLGKYASAFPAQALQNRGKDFTSLSILAFEWPYYDKNHVVDNDGLYSHGFSRLLLENNMGLLQEPEDVITMVYSKNNSKNWGQMVIAPVGQSTGYSFTNSGIILDATRIYGPSTSIDGWISSDRSLKENIEPLKYSLDDLKKINVYEYNYLDEPSHRRIGVIAQEVLKVIPEAVNTSDKDTYTVMPDWVFYPMINAIKELDKTVEKCKATLVAYAKEYNTLSAKMKELETEQKQLEKERKSLERRINKAYKKAEKMEKSA
mgnify:CR=1 FL=1